MATKIIAPNIWGWLADHTGHRLRIIRLASFLSVIAFAGVYFNNTYLWLMLVMFAFSFFWNANLPQFEAITLAHLGKNTHQYSTIRLWGSIGFILAVVLIGAAIEDMGAEWIPLFMVLLLLGVWILSLLTPDCREAHHDDTHVGFMSVIKQPVVLSLLFVCFLLQASHGPYYAFYTIYLEDNAYTRSTIGLLWGLGVLAEIVIFLFMHRLMPRFGARNLLIWALALTGLRWLIIGTSVDSHTIMIFAQLLHAASFGLYHAVAIHLIHRFFPGKLTGRGQALYSSVSFGAGGAIGALYSGYVWESGGAQTAYSVSAFLCLVACLITYKMIHER
jgi:PPP family 3-phenylpropionic acid transporter